MMKNKLLLILLVIAFAILIVRLNLRNNGLDDYFSSLQIVWKFKTSDPITSTPTVDGKRIFIRTINSVYALDSSTGLQLWQLKSLINSPLSLAPIAYGNYLIVPEADSRIAVFSADKGQLIWRTPVIDPVLTHPAAIDIEAIVAQNNNIYVARFGWALTAYRLESGEVLWEHDLAGRSNPNLAIDDKAIYLGVGPKLKALDLVNGNLLWEYEVGGYIGPMTIDENILFVLDEEYSNVLAIDVNNHLLKWEDKLAANNFAFNCIQVQSDKVYVSSQSLIVLSKYSGQLMWQSKKTGPLECPVMNNDNIYVRNTNTSLFVFKGKLGEEIGKLRVSPNSTMKHEPNRSPVISNGLLIIPIKNYEVVAISLE
jgi:outer membrane protein assembly factor BamB